MDNVSVSKGVFTYKGKYKIGENKKQLKPPNYVKEAWYLSYNEAWTNIQKATESIRSNMFKQILGDLELYVLKVKNKTIDSFANEIATAIVLTGINVPDHVILFESIISKLRPVTKHVAIIWSRDCTNIKSMIEEMIYQITSLDSDASEMKRSHCTMRYLKYWYQQNWDPTEPLVIIITDFESSPPNVLHDFISILSSYSDDIKFFLIFGVATTLHVIHRSLSYDVTSKLSVQVFHTQTQINILSDVLESTVFHSDIPFRLTGRAFQLLTDIFLFYDFSAETFLQSYKICMIQHFYDNNINSLCCRRSDISTKISALTEEDIRDIKQIPSMEKHFKHLSDNQNKDKAQSNKEMKIILEKILIDFHKYMNRFLTILKCLHRLTATLPNSPLGKQLREFYTKAVYVKNITETPEYKECLQMLSFLSKKELLSALRSILSVIENSKDSNMKKIRTALKSHMKTIEEASLDVTVAPTDIVTADAKLSRAQLKEKLLKMSQQQSRSPYKIAQTELLNYVDQHVFSIYLVNPNQVAGNEIFCFSDGNLAKQHIRGSLRAAIHTGLNDPQIYLNCECCKLENDDAIPSTLPDLSIIYKLHLESRKLINMYDWLQAFLIIMNPNSENSEQQEVDPKLQARFTQAVAELEFLGFIKTFRKKTDHVKRLT